MIGGRDDWFHHDFTVAYWMFTSWLVNDGCDLSQTEEEGGCAREGGGRFCLQWSDYDKGKTIGGTLRK